MQKLTLTLVIFASISMSSLAFAQRPGGGGGFGERGARGGGPRGMRGGERPVSPLMTALDANKDGKLSAEEISNAATALKALDKNEDGVLDSSELTPPRPERGGRGGREGGGRGGMGDPSERINRMMEMDADKDGKISKEEGGDRMSRFFDYVDSDSDGYLTKKEIEESMKRWQGGGGGGRGGRGGGGEQPKAKANRPAFDDN